MSRISDAFKGSKAFIPYITAGDPTLDVTKATILKMVEAGADMIEIGIPFSDPVAEGPTIQAASERALKNFVNVDQVFEMVAELRETVEIPLIFMTYVNPIFVYGVDKFMARCSAVGVDGVIVPDVPFEEKGLLAGACTANGVDLISMIAPSSEDRIAMIASEGEGFIYVVSSLGVTGVRSDDNFESNIDSIVAHIRTVTDVPCAIGFGISNPAQAAAMAEIADGAIVGSAIVNIVAAEGAGAPEPVYDFVKSMADSVHGVGVEG
ncbi:tryptophan synthase subunit alpha [Aerococcus agrisoli]|uniref:Tryptophan synthase alpha chain n=1 Tax=Aerococcus agrisoli TaxID=2487350 RepID=A0A3N4H6A5_9LACT|nr:tryptophan synthase subunit alpha [Aerococcus agrisoli]RPA60704.1 tryptophan synthase subunit alpha [Aerococcus agrisoli]